MIRRNPSDEVGTLLVSVPFGVTFVDDVLGKVSALETATDLVKVADSSPGRCGDEDRPMVKSAVAIGTFASGELRNLNREVTRGNLNPSVPFVYDRITGFRRRSKARGVGCGARKSKGSARRQKGDRNDDLTFVNGHQLGGVAAECHCECQCLVSNLGR